MEHAVVPRMHASKRVIPFDSPMEGLSNYFCHVVGLEVLALFGRFLLKWFIWRCQIASRVHSGALCVRFM